jgi:hypothetical protein
MNQKNKKTFDEQLADYTDNILDDKTGEMEENPTALDPELQSLEKTALRLKNAFHDDDPSEEVIQRMRKNIAVKWQQQQSREKQPFWKKWLPFGRKWQSQRSRQRFRMAVSLGILLAILFAGVYFLNGSGSDQPATSGQNLNASLVFIVGGLIILFYLNTI